MTGKEESEAGKGRATWPYPNRRGHYAESFGQTVRTINRWVAHGRKLEKLPPLDNPPAMAGWWGETMKHRVPESLLILAGPPLIEVPILPLIGEPLRSVTGDTVSVSGMMGMLARVRKEEEEAAASYRAAKQESSPDLGKIEGLRRAWDGLADMLRKLEKDAPGIMGKSGDSLPRAETVETLIQLHGSLAMSWRTFARRVLPRIRGLSVHQADKIWNDEVDRLYEQFHATKLAEII